MHYIPKVICLPSLAHLYFFTKSNWEENSCFLGHCSQKNKYIVKKKWSQKSTSWLCPNQHLLLPRSKKILKNCFFCVPQETFLLLVLLFSCPRFTPTVKLLAHIDDCWRSHTEAVQPWAETAISWSCWTLSGKAAAASTQEPGISLSVRD